MRAQDYFFYGLYIVWVELVLNKKLHARLHTAYFALSVNSRTC